MSKKEDKELVKIYRKDVEKAEKTKSKTYEVESAEELFKLLEENKEN